MEWDVIIVGAGSAGCVLAARLSEDPARRVLLIEAGPDYKDPAELPDDIASSLVPTFAHDWGFASEPGALGRPMHLPRGKVVGGCSATNGTFALRGTPDDYDGWAATGNGGWAFDEVLPYFRKLENDLDFHDAWHGAAGPLPIRRPANGELTPVQAAFLEACEAAGFARVKDHNAPGVSGAGPTPMNSIGGKRQSTALTYLAAARSRPNLEILSGATVDSVVFEGSRATGVRLAGGRTVAAQDVILSAGAYASPAILMRSGIGPSEHLRSHGIAVREDRPGVGQNLADHPLFEVLFAGGAIDGRDTPAFQTMLTLRSSPELAEPDLQVFARSSSPGPASPANGALDFALYVSVIRPESRGSVTLRSSDAGDAPAIDPGYFADPRDMPRMVAGVHTARRIAATEPLASLATAELQPGPDGRYDGEIEAAIREGVETYHHPTSTCRMGPAGDPMAVVDPRGRVHGFDRLYVIDASIMPRIPGANPHIPTLMVAERCADWLVGQSPTPEDDRTTSRSPSPEATLAL